MPGRRMLALVVLGGAGCGGGPAQLEVKLGDAPPDLASLSAVVVTFDAVLAHVIPPGRGGTFTPGDTGIDTDMLWRLLAQRPIERDLMMFRDGATTELGQIEMDEGQVDQIRIRVAPGGRNAVTRRDGASCAIDVSAVPATGFRVSHAAAAIPIQVAHKTRIVLDLPLSESLAEDGDCLYRLTPVLRIKSFEIVGADAE